ncbi:MAG: EamA family transporter [Alphaproteobacteria bacterium]|nr:EamA family transporter [Alphaproteobacteria bacterium]
MKPETESRSKGIILMVLTTFIFACTDTSVRWLNSVYSPFQIAAFCSAIVTAFYFLYAFLRGRLAGLRSRHPGKQFLRTVIAASGNLMAIYTFKYLTVPNAYAIFYAAPIIIALLSSLLLREHPTKVQGAAIIIGFGGMVYILSPDVTESVMGVGLAMGWMFCYCCNMLLIRSMPDEPKLTIPFYTALALFCISLPFAWNDLPAIETAHILPLVAISIAWGAGLLMLATAFMLAPAPLIAPLMYLEMLWATILGYLIWQTLPTPGLISGALVIILAGLMIVWDEWRQGRRSYIKAGAKAGAGH